MIDSTSEYIDDSFDRMEARVLNEVHRLRVDRQQEKDATARWKSLCATQRTINRWLVGIVLLEAAVIGFMLAVVR